MSPYAAMTITCGLPFRRVFIDKSWTPLTLKPQLLAPLHAGPAVKLTTGQETTAMKIDLRDFFDLSRPGTYRLHATADPKNPAYDKADEVNFTIVRG